MTDRIFMPADILLPNEKIDMERANYWLGVGAQPSDTVKAIIERAKKAAPQA